MKRLSSILWGIVLIAAGILFGLNALNILEINIFFDGWWTLFIIVPCAIGLFTEPEKIGNGIGVLIGVFLLLACQDILSFDLLWKLALPIVIIIIGLKMIFGGIIGNKSAEVLEKIKANGGELKNGTAVFAGQNMDFSGQPFSGAELNAVFGGVKCDLRYALLDQDVVINATAVFGGIEILVPSNVNVKINSNSLFGGVSGKNHQNLKENAMTVYVNGTAMFGGIEIK